MSAKRLFNIDPWLVATHQLDKTNKRLQESLTAIGNGYMGMRGNFEEGYSGDTLLGAYLAGVWFPDKTRVGWWKNGYPDYFGKAINAPSFINLGITINGVALDLAKNNFRDFNLQLDLHQGKLTRSFVYVTDDLEVAFEFERFVSMPCNKPA